MLIVLATVYSYELLLLPPEYDEVLISNTALNCPSNVFVEQVIWIKGQCVPIMLSSYIGGFMAIPYRIIFSVVGNSLVVFRLTNVVLALFSLGLVYLATKDYLSRKIALVTLFLLGIDFQFFYNVRLERTMVVPFLLKALFLFLVSLYVRQKKSVYLVLSGFVVGLSVWTKFDAMFFYGALFTAWVATHIKDIKVSKVSFKQSGIFGLGVVAGLVPLLYYLRFSLNRFLFIGKEVAGASAFSTFVVKTENLFFQSFSYDAINYITRKGVMYTEWEVLLATVTVIVFICAMVFAYKRKKLRPLVLAVLLFMVFTSCMEV